MRLCIPIGGTVTNSYGALNTLEKVALRYSKTHGRPSVLIINKVHHFNNDDDGRNVLLQLQQRAEAWATGGELQFLSFELTNNHTPIGIMTVVFTT